MHSYWTNGSNGGAHSIACDPSLSDADNSAHNTAYDQGFCDANSNTYRNTLAAHDSRCIHHGT